MNDGLKKSNFLNYSILIPYLLLSAIGLVMVFSTTYYAQLALGGNPYKQVINQTAFMLLSFVVIAIIYRMKLRAIKNRRMISLVLVFLVVSLLACRFAPGALFAPVNGARGWIHIPGIGTIQPAEIAKFFVVWYLGSIFSEKQDKIAERDFDEVFKGKTLGQKFFSGWRLPLWIMIILDYMMPDLGNAVILILLIFVMVGASGISWQWFKGYGIIGTVASILILGSMVISGGALANLIPMAHVRSRFIAFVNPFADQQVLASVGHQMANSYYAIANGGWTGRGLGNSVEKMGYLPEATTDFIFPVVVEELGIIGAIIILGILFFLIARILQVGIKAKNSFNSLMSIGIASLLLIQIFINLGGAIGIIPETGVTFPFISQGGSSFLILSIGIAFVLNISADEKRREITELTTEYRVFRG
ncbi:FtsW/RodA/SpoVE family cell cycle protein [Lactococcus termiticola]|nr:FtsW/RodA/SpoVE family cell cycle protein [Lactococcus termiticola]